MVRLHYFSGQNARLIFFEVSVRHQFDSGMEHLEQLLEQQVCCGLGGYDINLSSL
jgi:hypothetical protein